MTKIYKKTRKFLTKLQKMLIINYFINLTIKIVKKIE